MSIIRNDKDDILDRCSECGALAGWILNGNRDKWGCSCRKCPNKIDFIGSKFDAAVEWNKTQRKSDDDEGVSGIVDAVKDAFMGLVKDDVNQHEAACIALAYTLKTKLYLMGETSFHWSEKGKALFDHEMKVINE